MSLSLAFMVSAVWGRLETVSMLIDAGADLGLKYIMGKTALDYAREVEEESGQLIAFIENAMLRKAISPCPGEPCEEEGMVLGL